MSTTVGNGLTVDGTVKASQATQAGEAVVLGDDGLIPANLVASGGNMNVVSYSSWTDVCKDSASGKIPPYAEAYIELGWGSGYYNLIKVSVYYSNKYPIMPATGTIHKPSTSNKYAVYGMGENTIYYNDNNNADLKSFSLSSYTISKIKVVWRD